jgi:anti-sigma factor RsiW
MHEDMHNLLNAYLDGELHGTRRLEMKNHIASCPSCQEEIKELQTISELLQAAPVPDFISPERFISNLTLSLPRRDQPVRSMKPAPMIWWLAPVGLLLAWFFVRTVFTLASVVAVTDSANLLGQASSWFGEGLDAFWFPAMSGLLAGQGAGISSALSLLNEINVIGADLLSGFLWQAGIALLYMGWLALWWFTRRPQLNNGAADSVQP